jgi:farnesyl diphosphate synthase
MQSAFELSLEQDAHAVESALVDLLNSKGYPARLRDAMLHAVSGPAKRIRPHLLMETARLFKVDNDMCLPAAASLECVHCYSLIHDDLPCMDNDSLRRGLPTVHIAYDEATAILSGDALLTMAFEILGGSQQISADIRLSLINELSYASGASGMAAGQMLDLSAEGRFEATNQPLQLNEAQIFDLQARKTGALIRYAVRAGALLGNASEKQLAQLTRYGEKLGILYQIADDLLDATSSQDKAGKAVAKDAKAGKATIISVRGIEGARALLAELVIKTQTELTDFNNTENLKTLPAYLATRLSE